MSEIDLSVIVICRNQGEILKSTDEELCAMLVSLGLRTELIYVDNGSSDDTLFRLKKIVNEAGSSGITKQVIALRRNVGMSSAFMAGAAHSQGRFLLNIDPLLTVDPVDIQRLIEEIEKGYDLVVGWRKRDHLSAFVRNRSAFFNRITSWVTGLYLHDYGSLTRLMRRELLPDLHMHGELLAFMPAFAHAAGARIAEVPVTYRPDKYIGSEYTPGGLLHSFLDLITVWFLTRYSHRPMHIFGSLGLLFIFSAFITLIIAVVNRESTGVSLIQTPLPTLAGVLLAIGILTMLLGLTTEIVIRSYYEGQGKTSYSVREIHGQ